MSKSYILSRMDWAKAYKDYEELKVGDENLLLNSIDLQKKLFHYNNSQVTQSEIGKNLFQVNTTGGTSIVKARVLLNQSAVVNNLKDLFNKHSQLYFGIYIENNGNKEMTFRLNGIKDELGKNVSLAHTVKQGFKGIINMVGSGLVENASYQMQYNSLEITDDLELVVSPLIVSNKQITSYAPSSKDINARPFPAQVAHDMYQAKTGNWDKAEQDYELLKVGKENLFPSILDNRWVKHPNLTIKNEYSFSAASGANMSTRYELDVKAGEEYSVSWKGNGRICISVYDSEKERVFHTCTSAGIGSFTVPDSGILLDLAFSKSSNQINELVSWENVKLEKGKRTTPFTPSPQSIDANDFIVNISNDSSNLDLELSELRNAILQLGGK